MGGEADPSHRKPGQEASGRGCVHGSWEQSVQAAAWRSGQLEQRIPDGLESKGSGQRGRNSSESFKSDLMLTQSQEDPFQKFL